jgi:UDP-3-O-[3-hydroxymyristoyl] glucosamine N-acyltransferase
MVEAGDIVFVDHPKYYEKALNSAATTIIIDKIVHCPEGKALLISEKPFDSYNWLTQHFAPLSAPNYQVHMKSALELIAKQDNLSSDVAEVIEKALNS